MLALDTVEWAFPVIESIHIFGMALLVGTVAAGVVRRKPPAELRRWTHAALGLMIITGPLLFSTDPPRYLANPAFRFKMGVLAAAILVQFTLLRSPRWSRPAAGLSLVLWITVVVAARWIATY